MMAFRRGNRNQVSGVRETRERTVHGRGETAERKFLSISQRVMGTKKL